MKFVIDSKTGTIKGSIEVSDMDGLINFAEAFGRFEFIKSGQKSGWQRNDSEHVMLYFHDEYD